MVHALVINNQFRRPAIDNVVYSAHDAFICLLNTIRPLSLNDHCICTRACVVFIKNDKTSERQGRTWKIAKGDKRETTRKDSWSPRLFADCVLFYLNQLRLYVCGGTLNNNNNKKKKMNKVDTRIAGIVEIHSCCVGCSYSPELPIVEVRKQPQRFWFDGSRKSVRYCFGIFCVFATSLFRQLGRKDDDRRSGWGVRREDLRVATTAPTKYIEKDLRYVCSSHRERQQCWRFSAWIKNKRELWLIYGGRISLICEFKGLHGIAG